MRGKGALFGHRHKLRLLSAATATITADVALPSFFVVVARECEIKTRQVIVICSDKTKSRAGRIDDTRVRLYS